MSVAQPIIDPAPALPPDAGAWFGSGGLNAGAGVGRLELRFRAWRDVMRVLMTLLLIGIAGCGESDQDPADERDGQRQSGRANRDPVAAFVTLGAQVARDEQGHVTFIVLDRTPVTDAALVHLSNLEKLTYVSLGSPQFTDRGLMRLRPLTTLEHLHLTRAQITDRGLFAIRTLVRLKVLFLGETQITDVGLKHVKTFFHDLEELELRSTQITDAGLHHLIGMKSLKKLDLSNTQVTDDGLAHLKGVGNLNGLNLTGTKTTDKGVADLQKALPNCKIEK